MKIKVQLCWCGGDKFVYRALVCGGLRVLAPDGKWTRSVASEMLDLIESNIAIERRNIRFTHV